MLDKQCIKPKRLSPGDTLGVIAPASPGNKEQAQAGFKWLEEQGFKLKLGRSVTQTYGFLAGPDDLRLEDIHTMFADPEVNGIICLRGGYGTMRLLPELDYNLISANPKVFVGYSDITALHITITQQTGLVTFHGPMVASDMNSGLSEYTRNYLTRAVASPYPLGLINNPPSAAEPMFITPGTAAGELTGGNLSLIAATLGTPYEINTQGKILCLEEVGEAPYRIDRMLTQLLLAGKLQAAAGIVFDVCADCDTDTDPPNFTVEEVLRDRLEELNKPVLYKLYFGHTSDKATIPFGIKATLSTEAGGLIVMESATAD